MAMHDAIDPVSSRLTRMRKSASIVATSTEAGMRRDGGRISRVQARCRMDRGAALRAAALNRRPA
ncbi:hypothetical protein A8D80_28120 [Burkholderia cenocepacia]|nr:hypothetical protein A8D73_30250 [Burkholderia cenocepacia]ONP10751.1 hypothetical protein A8D80_28120 [Burkholderia cenocepacia]